MTLVRGVRGAVVAGEASEPAVLAATRTLLEAILAANPTLQPDDLAGAFFTVTQDLQVTYPARAARDLGWNEVPLLCALEIAAPGSLAHCIRVLLLWNTDLSPAAIRPVYLGAAAALRPDLLSHPGDQP